MLQGSNNVSFRKLRQNLCNNSQLPLIVCDCVDKIAAPAHGY